MSIVVIADGVIGVEGTLKAANVEELLSVHGVERDLAEDSVVEEACRLKDKLGGAGLTLISTAPDSFEKEMRSYIAAGCDRAIRIECDPATMFSVKHRAQRVARELGRIDDWRVAMFLDRTAGGAPALLPHYVSQHLGVPSIASVVSAEQSPEGLLVSTRRAGMIGRYRCQGQVILAVSSRVDLRNLGFKDVHRARKAQIEVIEVQGGCPEPVQVIPLAVREPCVDEGNEEVAVEALSVDAASERLVALLQPYLSMRSN